MFSSSVHRYLVLKVCVRTRENDPRSQRHANNEIKVSKALSLDDSWGQLVRRVLDSFDVAGPHGTHKCLLYQPLGMSFREFADLFPHTVLPTDLVQRAVQLMLMALEYLHRCHVVHTGLLLSTLK